MWVTTVLLFPNKGAEIHNTKGIPKPPSTSATVVALVRALTKSQRGGAELAQLGTRQRVVAHLICCLTSTSWGCKGRCADVSASSPQWALYRGGRGCGHRRGYHGDGQSRGIHGGHRCTCGQNNGLGQQAYLAI